MEVHVRLPSEVKLLGRLLLCGKYLLLLLVLKLQLLSDVLILDFRHHLGLHGHETRLLLHWPIVRLLHRYGGCLLNIRGLVVLFATQELFLWIWHWFVLRYGLERLRHFRLRRTSLENLFLDWFAYHSAAADNAIDFRRQTLLLYHFLAGPLLHLFLQSLLSALGSCWSIGVSKLYTLRLFHYFSWDLQLNFKWLFGLNYFIWITCFYFLTRWLRLLVRCIEFLSYFTQPFRPHQLICLLFIRVNFLY
jgi:hypothetical protein